MASSIVHNDVAKMVLKVEVVMATLIMVVLSVVKMVLLVMQMPLVTACIATV